MTTYRLLAAVAIFSTLSGTAMAQQAMSEPGYCAFFYPNANCQNKGPGNPYTDLNYRRSVSQGYVSPPGQTVSVARKRSRTDATGVR